MNKICLLICDIDICKLKIQYTHILLAELSFCLRLDYPNFKRTNSSKPNKESKETYFFEKIFL